MANQKEIYTKYYVADRGCGELKMKKPFCHFFSYFEGWNMWEELNIRVVGAEHFILQMPFLTNINAIGLALAVEYLTQ